jgi:hypothetical protein
MTAAENLLAAFPKDRPPLPEAIRAIYDRQFLENRSGATQASSLAQRLEAWMHRQVAADVRSGVRGATLELGAGTLNQLAHEPVAGDYDIVEPFETAYRGQPGLERVRDAFPDMSAVPADRRYRRITTIAALEHVCDLPVVLARAALLLEPQGELRAAIPSEGGLVWTLGWSMTTGLEFRLRHKLDYGDLMRHEHVNQAREIETLAAALFETFAVKSFGVGRQLSLYRFFTGSKPRLDVARAWLVRYEG